MLVVFTLKLNLCNKCNYVIKLINKTIKTIMHENMETL